MDNHALPNLILMDSFFAVDNLAPPLSLPQGKNVNNVNGLIYINIGSAL